MAHRRSAGLEVGAWSFYISDGHRPALTLSVATAASHVRLGDSTSRCLLIGEKPANILSRRGPLILPKGRRGAYGSRISSPLRLTGKKLVE
jgi:hypothetical protein